VGLFIRKEYARNGAAAFCPGDRLVLYTAGITEQFDDHGIEEFGEPAPDRKPCSGNYRDWPQA